jgi:cytosine permease
VEGIFIGDYARFGKGRKNVLVALVIGCIPTGFLILFFGAAGSIVLGQPNIIMILVRYGFPAIGLISLALSAWTTNVMNAYSGGYGLSCLLGLGANRFAASTGIVGLAGTVLGALGIMGWFSAFLNFLAISFPPMAGVIIASYWIRGERSAKKLNVPGIIAYAVSVAAALVTSTAVPFLIGPLNGIVCAVILYCLLAKLAGHGRAKDV